MRALPSSHVPSSSLLRFLRSQTDTLCFFTANSPAGCAPASWPCQKQARIPSSLAPCQSTSRTLSTTARRNVTLEASVLNLDFLVKPESSNVPAPLSFGRPSVAVKPSNQDGRALLRRWLHSEQESWRRWFALRKRSREKSLPLRPTDLPPLPFLSDASGATLGRMKAANELKLRCTEFDENGNVVIVDGEFKKSELIAKVRLIFRFSQRLIPMTHAVY